MEVILVRHAIAHERNHRRWPDDSQRPLTEEGVRKFRKAARGIAACLPTAPALLTSPYVRARETAALLGKVAKLPKATECPELAASESAQRGFVLLRTRKERAAILVGHEPWLSQFLAAALGGAEARLRIEFKKGGAASIEFKNEIEPGQACLHWMIPPRFLRALRHGGARQQQ